MAVISVKEARKILGQLADNMSDEEVEKLIDNLSFIAEDSLKKVRKKLSEEELIEIGSYLNDFYVVKKADNGDKKE